MPGGLLLYPSSHLETYVRPDNTLNALTAAISFTVNTKELVLGLGAAGEGANWQAAYADLCTRSSFCLSLWLQFSLLVSRPGELMGSVYIACQSHLAQAAPFPDLTSHPSSFLRSRQPTWPAPPTAISGTTVGKAMTAVTVRHLFYLWFLLHRKFQD